MSNSLPPPLSGSGYESAGHREQRADPQCSAVYCLCFQSLTDQSIHTPDTGMEEIAGKLSLKLAHKEQGLM